uniref:Uncharacterized protein n=1 Tax=Molossus molossus TaxID=27622 RepID=A0A7J8BNH1_MOLMO|nr:hypothetical protein HJG59_010101 [Molossus molossus]
MEKQDIAHLWALSIAHRRIWIAEHTCRPGVGRPAVDVWHREPEGLREGTHRRKTVGTQQYPALEPRSQQGRETERCHLPQAVPLRHLHPSRSSGETVANGNKGVLCKTFCFQLNTYCFLSCPSSSPHP